MDEKLRSLVEVFFVIVIFIAFAIIVDTMAPEIYAGWLKKGFMILISILIIVAKHKPREYGLIPRNIRLSLKWGTIFLFVFIIPAFVVLGLYIDKITLDYSSLLIDFLWFLIFTGFAEELMFRGYIQSRLNECFTDTYNKFLDFNVTWHKGTLITGALIFGPIHILNAINFRTWEINLTISVILIAVMASLFGVLFGVTREISGDIIICSIVHGIVDFVAITLLSNISGYFIYWVPLAISFFIFFGFLFEKFIAEFKIDVLYSGKS
ncbi:MAG: CPBP family intramembrane glutamic endopeptidase [Candidatus Njordarchaeota archaeon]